MSQLNLIIGPAHLQEYDDEKEKEEERQRKKRLLKAFEDKFKVRERRFLNSVFLSAVISAVAVDAATMHDCTHAHNGILVLGRVNVNREGSLTGILSLPHWSPGL